MGNTLKHPKKQITYNEQQTRKGIHITSACLQGWRQYMQDFNTINIMQQQDIIYTGVFDGHGGPQVAYYVSQNLHKILKNQQYFKNGNYYRAIVQSFKKMDQKIGSIQGQQQLKQIQKTYHSQMSLKKQQLNQDIGTTANIVLLTKQKIYSANIGDTRSVLCRNGVAIPLSHDHKPQNHTQKQRIKKAGGHIHHNRINGLINISRTFGDFYFKKNKHKCLSQQMIISIPQIREIQRDKGQDQYIIIASDGVWEKYGNQYQKLIDQFNNICIKSQNWKQGLRQFLYTLIPQTLTQNCTGVDNMTITLILMDVWRMSRSSSGSSG